MLYDKIPSLQMLMWKQTDLSTYFVHVLDFEHLHSVTFSLAIWHHSLLLLGLCCFTGIWTTKQVACWIPSWRISTRAGGGCSECHHFIHESQCERCYPLHAFISRETNKTSYRLLSGEEVPEWGSGWSFPLEQNPKEW